MSTPGAANTAQQSQHEALDSIKQTVTEKEGTAHTGSGSLVAGASDDAGSSGVLEQAKPPASNPGSDDPTGGIAAGSGGKSSTAHIGSPQSVDSDGQSNPGGSSISTQISEVVSSFASALGLGGSTNLSGHDEPRQAEVADAENKVIGGTTTTKPTNTDNDNLNNDSHQTVTQRAYDYAAAGGAAVAGTAATAAAIVTGRNDSKPTDPATSSSGDNNNNNKHSHNTTTSTSTSSSSSTDPSTSQHPSKMSDNAPAKPSTDDSVPQGNPDEANDSGNAKGLEPTGKPPSAGAEGGKRGFENPDSIPTAGGERLGEKHWGESKPVPDLPEAKGEGEAAGVSSTAGQPTQEVQDNTAKNTGGATSGPDQDAAAPTSDEPKPSVIDKVKDALNIGK